jgi:predicted small secreted protein
MMRIGIILLFFLFILCSSAFFSCNTKKAGQGIGASTYNGTDSHDVGTACLSCHNSGGSNAYWWYIAGTVYKPDESDLNPNSTVYFFTSVNGGGSLAGLLAVDGKGNFYTSTLVDFGSGLYPGVKSSSGETRYMQSSTKNGDCNSCHTSSKRIIVN